MAHVQTQQSATILGTATKPHLRPWRCRGLHCQSLQRADVRRTDRKDPGTKRRGCRRSAFPHGRESRTTASPPQFQGQPLIHWPLGRACVVRLRGGLIPRRDGGRSALVLLFAAGPRSLSGIPEGPPSLSKRHERQKCKQSSMLPTPPEYTLLVSKAPCGSARQGSTSAFVASVQMAP